MKKIVPEWIIVVTSFKTLTKMVAFNNKLIGKLSLTLAFSTLAISLTSCFDEGDLGEITTQERIMDEFYGIDLDGIGDVELISSNDFSVEIRTHVNLLDDVITTIEGGILKIDLIGNHKKIDDLRYEVYVPYCNYIRLDGVGNIYCEDGFTAQSLKIVHDGVGDINLQNIWIEELDVNLDDVGNIELSGSTSKEVVFLDGVGNYNAFDLISDTAEVIHDGVGDVRITVNDHLKVNAKGVGKVYYKGDPIVDVNVTGTGGLVKVD